MRNEGMHEVRDKSFKRGRTTKSACSEGRGPAGPPRDRTHTLNSHGDGQETAGAPSVADVGGHGGPFYERRSSLLRASEPAVGDGSVRGKLTGTLLLRTSPNPFRSRGADQGGTGAIRHGGGWPRRPYRLQDFPLWTLTRRPARSKAKGVGIGVPVVSRRRIPATCFARFALWLATLAVSRRSLSTTSLIGWLARTSHVAVAVTVSGVTGAMWSRRHPPV